MKFNVHFMRIYSLIKRISKKIIINLGINHLIYYIYKLNYLVRQKSLTLAYLAPICAKDQYAGSDLVIWREREMLVCNSPDNCDIPRHLEAGNIKNGLITMHNGLKVVARGYYGVGMAQLLCKNKGVHEPQEEKVFFNLLPHIPGGSTMIELGAYWGFYSLWFAKNIPNSSCYLIEPELNSLHVGRLNFQLNNAGFKEFFNAFIGKSDSFSVKGVPIVCIDSFVQKRGITHVAILHADIQGAELEMLRGFQAGLAGGLVDYLFISTHSNELHDSCSDLLCKTGYDIKVSINLNDSYSYDGLIVASKRDMPFPSIALSYRSEEEKK